MRRANESIGREGGGGAFMSGGVGGKKEEERQAINTRMRVGERKRPCSLEGRGGSRIIAGSTVATIFPPLRSLNICQEKGK